MNVAQTPSAALLAGHFETEPRAGEKLIEAARSENAGDFGLGLIIVVSVLGAVLGATLSDLQSVIGPLRTE